MARTYGDVSQKVGGNLKEVGWNGRWLVVFSVTLQPI